MSEEKIKAHIGAGTVYLNGWVNLDLDGDKVHLAKDRPDLVERYKTDETNYYGRHGDKNMDNLRDGPKDDEYVCDKFGSFQRLPFGIAEVDEILARHSFEHLSIAEARKSLDEVDRVLKPGGILRIDVPDHEGTLQKYKETGDAFYIRHLLGPRRDEYGYHMMSYTKNRLISLVEEFGLIKEAEETNIHFYPAFCIRFRKPPVRLARDYALDGVMLDPEWKVADVGPGKNPLQHPNCVYIDNTREFMDKFDGVPNNRKVQADLNRGLPFPDKYFDFIFSAHVVEHTNDPEFSVKEICRIAKEGIFVVPHAFKDFLFLFEEGQHKFWFFPPIKDGGPVLFMPNDDKLIENLKDKDVLSVMCRLLRTGPNRLDHDQRKLRRWFYEKEPYLDIIVHWRGELKLQRIK